MSGHHESLYKSFESQHSCIIDIKRKKGKNAYMKRQKVDEKKNADLIMKNDPLIVILI